MRIIRLLIAAIGLTAASLANATFTCTGTVTYLGMDTGGTITFSNGFGVWYLCGVSSVYNGVSTEACKSWYAGFLSAQKTGGRISVYFSDSGSWGNNDSRCGGLGSWVAPSPYYIQFMDP